ncbi:MAG: PfkB domain-containing protein [Gammaproteobacteria bacterium]|nr:MAG: PfkB domain-containing protein [Gammaproteobacteria bacterium]
MVRPSSGRDTPRRPLVFGEVLFDQFADGSSVLGGAPFNVAWHLQGFGLDPLLISRVGDDALGEQMLAAMMIWGMDISGIQTDTAHPTGTVQVALKNGQPTFFIVPDQAYDFIDAGAAIAAIAGTPLSMLYHGTLGARQPVSRGALDALRRQTNVPRFVDINLRPPWSTMELATNALYDALRVKVNNDEIKQIASYERLPDANSHELAAALRRHFRIGMLMVTCGEQGAFIDTAQGIDAGKPVKVKRLVDTVGAGDAFSAVSILGLTGGWPVATILARALAFASAICGVRGATTTNQGLYASYIDQWERDAGR